MQVQGFPNQVFRWPTRAAQSEPETLARETLLTQPRPISSPHDYVLGAPLTAPSGRVYLPQHSSLVELTGSHVRTLRWGPPSDAARLVSPYPSTDGTVYFQFVSQNKLVGFREGERLPDLEVPSSVCSRPVSTSDGKVVVGGADKLYTFAQSGELLETRDLDQKDRFPNHITPAKEGWLVLNGGKLTGLGPTGERWAFEEPSQYSWVRSAVSDDRVLPGGYKFVGALDLATGQPLWRHDLDVFQAGTVVPPVVDREGGVHALCKNGDVLSFSKEGELRGTIHTKRYNQSYMTSQAGLAVTARGDLAVLNDTEEFHLYDQQGTQLIKLTAQQLFDDKYARIHGMALSPDGKTAYLAANHSVLTEVQLPAPKESVSQVGEGNGFVSVGGVRLRRRPLPG